MSKQSQLSQLIADIKEDVLFLQELGVDVFDSQIPERNNLASHRGQLKTVDSGPWIVHSDSEMSTLPAIQHSKTEPKKKNGSRLSALPSLKNRDETAANETAFTRPVPSNPELTERQTEIERAKTALFAVATSLKETNDTIESIRVDIGVCTRCPLHAGRTQVVHTTGNFNADLMFVGEAPGKDEDAQGFPFVGKAGQLLTRIIEGIGYQRDEVAIGNINRCRPPENRAPTLEEALTCRPFLLREIAVIRPKVIVVMGNTAMHNLLDTKVGITRMRGNFQDYYGVKVMPTFHPAYLLRDPNKKREVWEDMKKVRAFLKTP